MLRGNKYMKIFFDSTLLDYACFAPLLPVYFSGAISENDYAD
ncbi:hypothetical protein SLEP1_g976 [Rubroshorea leprosula]|uniref:Uncharacterized protein n=1 Tax=Rubroshorea leprosula TaxID=152421 RepID=A0AAV5HN67_9ROSI|nr:hypothetical protein SLEP1_g976 [Rubroshorea leprosula]